MQKAISTILALLLTAALFFMLLQPSEKEDGKKAAIARIWLVDTGRESSAFLKKAAAAWEKQGRGRIYLRSAARAEAEAALRGESGVLPPDLIIGLDTGEKICAMGYALILPDADVLPLSPAPTSLLFSPPTPTPGPTPTLAPAPDFSGLAPILCPAQLKNALPGCQADANPLNGLKAQTARAALLTAGQALSLQTGYHAYALPEGRGAIFCLGKPLSDQGNALLSFLQSEKIQGLLKENGLYSPFFPLYGIEDPLRARIDAAIPRTP